MIQTLVFSALLFVVIAAFVWSVRAKARADRRWESSTAASRARLDLLAAQSGDRTLAALERRLVSGGMALDARFAEELERLNAELSAELIALGRRITRVEAGLDESGAAVIGRIAEMRSLFRQADLVAHRAGRRDMGDTRS